MNESLIDGEFLEVWPEDMNYNVNKTNKLYNEFISLWLNGGKTKTEAIKYLRCNWKEIEPHLKKVRFFTSPFKTQKISTKIITKMFKCPESAVLYIKSNNTFINIIATYLLKK